MMLPVLSARTNSCIRSNLFAFDRFFTSTPFPTHFTFTFTCDQGLAFWMSEMLRNTQERVSSTANDTEVWVTWLCLFQLLRTRVPFFSSSIWWPSLGSTSESVRQQGTPELLHLQRLVAHPVLQPQETFSMQAWETVSMQAWETDSKDIKTGISLSSSLSFLWLW